MNPNPSDHTEPLAAALQRAARVLATQQPPAVLREALLQRVAPPPSRPPATQARRAWGWRVTAWSGGAAVMAMLVVASAVLLLAPPPEAPLKAAGGEFMPLVPREDWPDEASPAWLVASELPQERLAALGLPYDPARAADRVRAELLVHPSGLVLALRLID